MERKGIYTDNHKFEALEKELMDKLNSVVEFLRKDSALKKAYMHTYNKY